MAQQRSAMFPYWLSAGKETSIDLDFYSDVVVVLITPFALPLASSHFTLGCCTDRAYTNAIAQAGNQPLSRAASSYPYSSNGTAF